MLRRKHGKITIKKEHNNDKTTTYKLEFIDTCRFIQSKLSDLVDNLSEINNKDCKTCMERKNIKSECEFIGFKNNRLNYRCKECNEISTKSINGLIQKFPRMYQFCNGDRNDFVLLLRKSVLSISIDGKDLMKHHYHLKNIFTVN